MNRSIFVSMPDFRIDVLEDGQPARVITQYSVGRPGHTTPMFENGALSTDREQKHWSQTYGAWMPFSLFFEQAPGCAFHAGNPAVASHGCIHLPQADAEWLYGWAAKFPVGLTIRGPYPDSPTRPTLYALGVGFMLADVVTAIQQALIAKGYAAVAASGVFDAATDAAIRQFQAQQGLTVDGKVGPNTSAALGVAL